MLTNASLKNYRIFISHAWNYNDSYYKLEKMLNEAPRFKWSNHSVPKHDSLDTTTDKELTKELIEQISGTNVILIVSGMYYGHSKWIMKEIEIAQNMNKPIIAIRPRGQQRTPTPVQLAAKEVVGWSTSSIVQAIRQHSL
ncbi:TIR domain-containing protein [Guptibacillus sedimenti]|uniref:TIR domain-containing protein n=1 Tax=Guptibacillus sedimenti TaxID=3025680 RepID=UPI00235F4DED|nr:TIR domain-containing protein [Pseudalkalibacillus sedimenti]